MRSSDAPEVTPDRYLFLFALQQSAPDFWRGLKSSTAYGTSVECWAEHAGVVDSWFLTVLNATIARWRERPDDGGSQLLDGYEWFAYPKEQPAKSFAPQFTDPYPRFSGIGLDADLNTYQTEGERTAIKKTQRLETPEEFADRMTKQFNKAITKYKKYMRQLSDETDVRGQRRDHAQWTALVAFRGITAAEIAQNWPGLHGYADGAAAVNKAVNRFAADIGLTLPNRADRKSA